jgi:3-deoxy-alpha-D-manno-octulosonate 8-oxidase
MFRNFRMVSHVVFGRGSIKQLGDILKERRTTDSSSMVFMVDDVFENSGFSDRLPIKDQDRLIWVNADKEPKTVYVDTLTENVRSATEELPDGIIGIGGGSVMDIAKAVSVMLKNPGSSADYQGWDKVNYPSVYHVGTPTLSGTGAEVSRTAILTGPVRKLGINSDYTVFDQIVLDPDLLKGIPKDQRFYTGMDCYIHCVESLEGTYLNAFSKAYGEKAMDLCRDVFLGEDRPESDEMLMMASYCGGMSIAYSQVGVCHALSYGLSYVLGLRHGIGNCVAMDYLEKFYPDGVSEFRQMCERHHIEIPRNVTSGVSESEFDKMIDVALTLEPLWENALGPEWKTIMTRKRIRELYERM